MLVDLGSLEEFPSNKIPGFVDGLVELLPSLEDHACSLGRRGGFVTRLKEGTWAGHVAEHIALELQNLAGTDVRHGKTRSVGPYGQYNVIYEFREESVGVEAGRMAVALVNHLVDPVAAPFDLEEELERLILTRRAVGLRAVDPGADRRGHQPRHPVHPARPPLAGPARPGRPPAADPGDDDQPDERDRASTSRSDKSLTNRLLDSAGLPVPRADVVDTEDGAVAAAKRLGFPCVVKPLDGNHGRGVHLDLRSEEAVRAAFHGALAQSRGGDVVVETYVAGKDYRCLVIGGKVAAIAERVPGVRHRRRRATPSASSSSAANQDPRRGIGHEKVLTRIKVDARRRGAGPGPGLRARRGAARRAPGSSSP